MKLPSSERRFVIDVEAKDESNQNWANFIEAKRIETVIISCEFHKIGLGMDDKKIEQCS